MMQPQIDPTNRGHRILILILVILLTAGVIVGATYYVLNKQNKSQQRLIDQLQKDSETQKKAIEDAATVAKKEKDKATETKTIGVKYTNSQYGFELTLPEEWKEYGTTDEIIEGGTKTIYFGLPRKEVNTSFEIGFIKYYDSPMAIGVYTIKQWEEAHAAEGPKSQKIGEKGGYIFGWSQGNGMVDVKGITQEQVLSDVKDIIKTFKIIN